MKYTVFYLDNGTLKYDTFWLDEDQDWQDEWDGCLEDVVYNGVGTKLEVVSDYKHDFKIGWVDCPVEYDLESAEL